MIKVLLFTGVIGLVTLILIYLSSSLDKKIVQYSRFIYLVSLLFPFYFYYVGSFFWTVISSFIALGLFIFFCIVVVFHKVSVQNENLLDKFEKILRDCAERLGEDQVEFKQRLKGPIQELDGQILEADLDKGKVGLGIEITVRRRSGIEADVYLDVDVDVPSDFEITGISLAQYLSGHYSGSDLVNDHTDFFKIFTFDSEDEDRLKSFLNSSDVQDIVYGVFGLDDSRKKSEALGRGFRFLMFGTAHALKPFSKLEVTRDTIRVECDYKNFISKINGQELEERIEYLLQFKSKVEEQF